MISIAATMVSNALLLLSSSPQNKCYQSQLEYISNDSKTDTLSSSTKSASTTGQLGVDQEASSSVFVPVTSTIGDSGLTLPSTVNSQPLSLKVNVTPRVMERGRTNAKRSCQPTPFKSHVRSLNFGNVVIEKSPRKRKFHRKSQLSSSVVRKTKNSDVVQAAIHLANQQSNINVPALKKGRSFAKQPKPTSGRNVLHLTDISQSDESPKSAISSLASCVGAIQGENDVQRATSAAATRKAQGDHHLTQLQDGSQVTQPEIVIHPTPFQTTLQKDTITAFVNQHRTSNIFTNQDSENTTVLCRTEMPPQSAAGGIYVVPQGNQSGFYTNTELLGLQSSSNESHRNSLPRSSHTTTFQSVISNSVPYTHCTKLVSQSFQPITASIHSNISQESKHIESNQPFTMVSFIVVEPINTTVKPVYNRPLYSSHPVYNRDFKKRGREK